MTNITILGTGAMGSRMAINLLEAGYAVTVFNRTRKRALPLQQGGALISASPLEAVKDADIVISMMSNDEASSAVWLDEKTGALAGLRKNTITIECSTLSLSWCLQLAAQIKSAGADFLDAPVVGSRPQAEARQLIHLVGGDAQVLERARKVLGAGAAAIHHIGPVGAGMSMKLAVNGIFGMQVAALSEILCTLEQTGISKKSAIGILNELPVTSPALKGIGALMAAGNHTPLFPIDLVEKDFAYVQRLAENAQLDPLMITAARKSYQTAKNKGFGADNISGVIQIFDDC